VDEGINPEDISILASVMGVTQETINHRKVVQEVHDSRILHRMVGVEPTVPVVVHRKEAKWKSDDQVRAAESVKTAWNSDAEESDDEEGHVPAPSAAVEEEDSRYDVRPGQPPLKRRRMGKEKDVHTVYTTDEDGDDDDNPGAERDVHVHIHDEDQDEEGSVTEEEGEYDLDGPGEGSGDVKTKKEQTRSYWLSKGIPT